MVKTSNGNARELVESLTDFQGNNTFAITANGVYKVYSYGSHFPIYAYKNNKWYANKDKYSVTTSKHQSQLRPSAELIPLTTEEIKAL